MSDGEPDEVYIADGNYRHAIFERVGSGWRMRHPPRDLPAGASLKPDGYEAPNPLCTDNLVSTSDRHATSPPERRIGSPVRHLNLVST